MKFFLCGLILLIVCSGMAMAGSTSRLELTDGSVVLGEITSFKGGVYTIKSHDLGLLSIPEDRIRVIQPGVDQAAGGNRGTIGQTPGSSGVTDLQKGILANGPLMDMVMSLQNDPDMQAVLSDPELMNAIGSGDYGALASNPKFQELMNNPKIKAILDGAQ